MFPAFLLALREGVEAALIIGIVLGALKKINRPDLRPAVWSGTFVAFLVSLLTGGLLTFLGFSLEGQAEAIFEGSTMLLAAGLLTWMIFWMNRQGQKLRIGLEREVHRAASASGRVATFGVAFLAVAREGVELALFLTATAFVGQSGPILLGALFGLGAAVVLGWLLFTAVMRLNLRLFFQTTALLLLLFAAGLVAHGIHEFNEVGWIPAVIGPIWNLNSWLDENSVAGQFLKVLFGYSGDPSLTEVLGYLAYLIIIAVSLKRQNRELGRNLASFPSGEARV